MSDSLLEKQEQLSRMQVEADELEVELDRLTTLKRQVGKPQGVERTLNTCRGLP